MKSIDPVLTNIYTRVDIIDYTDSKFSRTASVYLLGEHSKLVKSSKDVNIQNKQLVNAIGIPAIKELTKQEVIIGGDGSWDELDELDMEDLLNTETIIIPKSDNCTQACNKITEDLISDMVLYAKDKTDDVKEKIAIATNISPYKQYLWIPEFNTSIDIDGINLFKHYENSHRIVEGFPVDSYVKLDQVGTNYSIDKYAQQNVAVLYCVSLDAIIYNKSKLLMLAQSDIETFELIFNNAINIFFPSLDIIAFSQYLSNESELENKLAQYAFDKTSIRKKLDLQKKLLPSLNEIPKVVVDTSDFIMASTMNIILHFSMHEKQLLIDTTTLFKSVNIATLSQIVAMDLYSVDDDRRNVRLRKIQQFDQYRESLTLSSIVFPFNRDELLYNRCIVVFFMPTEHYSELFIIIDQYCNVWIKAIPNKSLTYTKKEFIDIIIPIINKTITLLNQQESAFMTLVKIPAASIDIYQIMSSSSRLTFKFSINYSKLVNLIIDTLLDAGFLEFSQSDKQISNKLSTTFILKYGVARNNQTKISEISIKNINGVALIELSNLDVEETNLYIEIVGRIIIRSGNAIKLNLKTIQIWH